MSNMENRLWDYIDGNCLPDERMAIEKLLNNDTALKEKYEELLSVHRQLLAMELEEPSLGFRNRVMEQVLQAPHPSTLKTHVDKRIISLIAAFFMLTIGGILAYTVSQIDWNVSSEVNLPQLQMPAINWSVLGSNSYMLFFLSLNVILGLALLDRMLASRKRQARP